jgi:hypothetical protein
MGITPLSGGSLRGLSSSEDLIPPLKEGGEGLMEGITGAPFRLWEEKMGTEMALGYFGGLDSLEVLLWDEGLLGAMLRSWGFMLL